MPGARVAVTTASTSSTASSTVGTASSAVARFGAKATGGIGLPSASPLWVTDTFTVKGSLVTPLRVRVKTAASPSVTLLPAEAIETSGRSLSATVTVARLPGAATTR